MCAAALGEAHVKRIVYGCRNERFGGCGSVLNVYDLSPATLGNPILEHGLFEQQAVDLFLRFYARENKNAVEAKRKKPRIPSAELLPGQSPENAYQHSQPEPEAEAAEGISKQVDPSLRDA
eukprot:ANDGO_02422.mRNA.1 tRNA-specific adenosine deaminase subunit tad2